MVLAAIPHTPSVQLDPDLVMVLFLPPLLLSSAFFTVWRDFRAELRPIGLLALGAVIFTTLVVGWVAKAMAPGLPWSACFALGAIVSPPDAVAAKAVLHGLALPRRVVTILEGESLVNDASGLVLYRLAVAAALTGAFSWRAAAVSFVWLSVGGIGFGILAGGAIAWLLQRRTSPHEVTLVSLLSSWGVYIVADLLEVSSVLAVVTCGLVMGWRQHDIVSAKARIESRAVWRFTVSVFESLVFVLIGLSMRGVLNRLGGLKAAVVTAGPFALAVVIAVICARLLWVYQGAYLPRWLARTARAKQQLPSGGILLVIGWAGMRGVVSLAAALALPDQFPGRDTLLFTTFAVIAVTVLIQGSTLGLLIKWLVHPAQLPTAVESLGENGARAAVNEASLLYLESLPADDGELLHPRLTAEYRRRVSITAYVRDHESSLGNRRQEHFGAALEALAAGRRRLIELHRRGEIHDSVLHSLERELDLEELRLQEL